MNNFISEIMIKSYRGIDDLSIRNLGNINLLVGNNNSGKTSVLESLKILSNPQINNICRTALNRNYSLAKNDFIDTILSMFKKDEYEEDENKNMSQTYFMNLSCIYANQLIALETIAEEKEKISLRQDNDVLSDNPNVYKIIEGSLKSIIGEDKTSTIFTVKDDIETDTTTPAFHSIFMPVNTLLYKSCISLYSDVVKENKKDDFIKVLNIFDRQITDISIVERTIWIHHKSKNTMPLYAYGTGLQKALLISIVLAMAKDGVLLIDEIETSIHTSALKEVFQFIIQACKEMNVQLFATTHSLEVIDALIECSNDERKNMRIIALSKESFNSKTYARVIDGQKAYEERVEYNMELRI